MSARNVAAGVVSVGRSAGAVRSTLTGLMLTRPISATGRGVQTECEGGGMANATIIERP